MADAGGLSEQDAGGHESTLTRRRITALRGGGVTPTGADGRRARGVGRPPSHRRPSVRREDVQVSTEIADSAARRRDATVPVKSDKFGKIVCRDILIICW